MAGTTISARLETDKRLVRKWGTQLLAVADLDVVLPTPLYDPTSHLPVELPTGCRQLGYITSDGVETGVEVSTEDTTMIQEIYPVRTDVSDIKATLKVKFGEASSAWVQALIHGYKPSEFAAKKDSPWNFDDSRLGDFPYMQVFWLGQDQDFYRITAGYYARVISVTRGTLQRSDAETPEVTFGFFLHPTLKKAIESFENGPAYFPAA